MNWEHVITIQEPDTSALTSLSIDLPNELGGLSADIEAHAQKLAESYKEAQSLMLDAMGSTSEQYQKQFIMFYNSIVSGRLFKSISIQLNGDTVRVGTDIDYVYYLENGRGEIRPKSAKCLHYFTKSGSEVFTRYAGPAKPRPYLTDSSKLVSSDLSKFGKYLGDLPW